MARRSANAHARAPTLQPTPIRMLDPVIFTGKDPSQYKPWKTKMQGKLQKVGGCLTDRERGKVVVNNKRSACLSKQKQNKQIKEADDNSSKERKRLN